MQLNTNKWFKFRQLVVFICTFLGYASYHACRQSFQDTKDPLTHTSDWDEIFTKDFEGIMNGIFLATYALAMLFIGSQLGDKFSASVVHSIGLELLALIYFLLGASIPLFNINSPIFFCGLWAINGLVQSVGWPTGVKLMANWFDGSHDGMIFGLWTACQSTGNILGSVYSDYVEDQNLPLQWNFWLPAIQAAIMGIIVITCVPTYPKRTEPTTSQPKLNAIHNVNDIEKSRNLIQQENDVQRNNNTEHDGVGLIEALKMPNIAMYGLIFACLKGVNYTLFFWLPDFLETNGEFSVDQSDQLSMYYNVGQIFGSWFCGFISDRFVRRTPTIFVFLILAVTPIFMFRISSPSYIFVAVLSSVSGFFMGGPSNLISSVMTAEVGKKQAEQGKPASLSTLSGVVDGMGGFGAAVCVYISTYIPVDVVFVMLSVLVVMSALLLVPLVITDVKYIIATKNGAYPQAYLAANVSENYLHQSDE